MILETVFYFLAIFGSLSLATCVLPTWFQLAFYRDQNLKSKYHAEWAFVSGGSSGIGLAIVEKLAKQGINVIIAALDDALMQDAKSLLADKYPSIDFRFVPVNLGSTDENAYMVPIINSTSDINVNVIFNNAGYIQVGLFTYSSIASIMSNVHCNAVSALNITHHFSNKLIATRTKGLIAFTSSPGGFMPSPMASLYSSTKGFITNFACSIAGELRSENIDVVVVHPSPTNTGFYNNAGLLGALKIFQKTAVGPHVIADSIFAAAGRSVVVDQGWYSVSNRVLLKLLDVGLMSELMRCFVDGQSDFQNIKANQKSSKNIVKS